MPQVNVFRWHAGKGWLVFSGGGAWDSPEVTAIESKMLTHTVSLGPIAYVWAAGDIERADRHMDSLRELGARTGYLIDIMTEQDDDIEEELREAGVIILGDGPDWESLGDAIPGVVLESIADAFRRGATIYAVGRSAGLLGAYVLCDGEVQPGYQWLHHAIIAPGYDAAQADVMHHWLREYPNAYGLGLGQGAALALGPSGEVEVWGDPSAITIALGQEYGPDGAAAGD